MYQLGHARVRVIWRKKIQLVQYSARSYEVGWTDEPSQRWATHVVGIDVRACFDQQQRYLDPSSDGGHVQGRVSHLQGHGLLNDASECWSDPRSKTDASTTRRNPPPTDSQAAVKGAHQAYLTVLLQQAAKTTQQLDFLVQLGKNTGSERSKRETLTPFLSSRLAPWFKRFWTSSSSPRLAGPASAIACSGFTGFLWAPGEQK